MAKAEIPKVEIPKLDFTGRTKPVAPEDGIVLRLCKGEFYEGYSVHLTKYEGGEVVSDSVRFASAVKGKSQAHMNELEAFIND